MNPSGPESAGMQLPAPVAEHSAAHDASKSHAEKQAENGPGPAAENNSGVHHQGMPMPTIPLPQAVPVQQNPQQAAVSGTTASGTPMVADDNDLIEKEWVNKAKQIVDRTRDDPYRQSEQLTGVKVEYMKKRYGKTIKTGA